MASGSVSGSYQAEARARGIVGPASAGDRLDRLHGNPLAAHRSSSASTSASVRRARRAASGCTGTARSRTGSARASAGASRRCAGPWPVTPMWRTRPSSRARASASTAPPGPWATSHSSGSTRLCSWIEVDVVDVHALQRPLELGAGGVALPLAGLGGQEHVVAVVGQPRLQAVLRGPVGGRRVDVVDAPRRRRSASVASARSWLMPPRAAAPKISRVESCPVRPNAAVGIMSPTVPSTIWAWTRPGSGRSRPGRSRSVGA